ncbi:MAG TPA: hypothetical protein VGP07_18150 [Polyangia bacterium]|jgi:hypothetical protein
MGRRGFATFVIGCAMMACACETGVVPPPNDGAAMADSSDAAAGNDAAASCSLLVASCPDHQGCYPYPFEAASPNGTLCAFQGIGDDSIPCQSQLDCDGQSICRTPGDPAAVCLTRCDPTAPTCPPGTGCSPLPGFPGVGTCTL